ncbi:LysM peptidoglycan-binding domain-containing protein [Salinisphaera sp. Q1T1-3]|uniref:LysM peptidoglycan-binding domain-containing protein n=1 Tax=Salinisphaera sp. Q1T1-3 TaxID=2321229 RepID=UPI000E71EA8E|nr:LysM domain-containing protein [Salinisphaera sp. Q1T1-3]RJS91257.1 LysM domain-containing protein [Salinisphaera sp. Q1T1-3]
MPRLDADPGYESAPDDGETTPGPSVPTRQTTDLASHMRDDAPTRYIVQQGDTLWAIASYYLDAPWLWPQLWHANPAIDDPDLIYPGDVLVLARGMDGTPRLMRDDDEDAAASGAPAGTVRLSPQVRVASLDDAIPVIPADAIREFLDSPRRVDAGVLHDAPYLVSLGDEQLVAGNQARVYVRGLPPEHAARYSLVRPADVYRDPENHRKLGREAVPVGEITIESAPADSDVAIGTLTRIQREARAGDRLLPLSNADLVRDFHPRTPAAEVATHIVSVYGGISQIGQYDVVALADEGSPRLSRGDVLDIYQAGRTVNDPIAGGQVRLPRRRAGQLMVFKNDGPVSYALVMYATRAIHVGDVVQSPGAS